VDVVKDDKTGEITEVHCTYDPQSRGGNASDGRKVKVPFTGFRQLMPLMPRYACMIICLACPIPVLMKMLTLFFIEQLNPNSLEVLKSCKLEPSLAGAKPGDAFQFLRLGYFCVDLVDSKEGSLVFNRTVTLKDTGQDSK